MATTTRWFPVVAFGWLLLVTVVVLGVPGLAHRMSAAFRHLDESPDNPADAPATS
ncbi:MAG TPA: hypothetical protein VIG79_16435 [Lapillicoccus sp.]|uniref:hypothetical protein n=1 Tax=Lapillicoccus sp. TaxID=1909287 RepID=UPI002F927431